MANTTKNTRAADLLGDGTTRTVIEAQPKRQVYIPLVQGEDLVLNVTVNGVGYTIVKGEHLDVPESIAQIVDDYLQNQKDVWTAQAKIGN